MYGSLRYIFITHLVFWNKMERYIDASFNWKYYTWRMKPMLPSNSSYQSCGNKSFSPQRVIENKLDPCMHRRHQLLAYVNDIWVTKNMLGRKVHFYFGNNSWRSVVRARKTLSPMLKNISCVVLSYLKGFWSSLGPGVVIAKN